MVEEGLNFIVNKDKCIKCGFCANDCPVNIIKMDNYPKINNEDSCLKCEHCFAICPTGAISILNDVAQDEALTFDVNPAELKKMIQSRRSIRQYKNENVDKHLVQELCDLAHQAPTAKNVMQVHFSVIDDKDVMDDFRIKVYEKFSKLELKDPRFDFFNMIIERWNNEKKDKLFAGAPHMIVASAPASGHNPVVDCTIALSYFELLAVSHGLGTLWNGVMTFTLNQLLPEFKDYLKIPEDHQVGYVMVFGKSAVSYKRKVTRNTFTTFIDKP